MNVRSLLFGSTLRIVVTALVGLGLLGGVAVVAGVVGAPSVVGVNNAFGPVNQTATVVETNLTVHNPNPVGVDLGGTSVNYTVVMNDIPMANGLKRGIAVGTGNSTLAFTTVLDNERIPDWWVSHLRNGERTELYVDTTVHSGLLGQSYHTTLARRTIETDVIGQFNSSEDRPVNASAPLVDDPVAWINRTNATWGRITDTRTPIRVSVRVHNPKATPIVLTKIGYTVTMNDLRMGKGATERTYTIPGGATETVRTTVALNNTKLDEWWVTHLRNDQVTHLRIDFYADVEVAGTTVRVPLRGMTYEKTIETDLFGNEAGDERTRGSVGESGDGGASGESNSTTTTGEGTASTTTTTTTTTTDGGLLNESTTTTTTTATTATTTSGNGSDGDGGGGLLAVEPTALR